MNDNRPAWERKLDRDLLREKIWKILGILALIGILFLLLYHIPLVTPYEKTFTGYELHYDRYESDPDMEHPTAAKESTVRFEGTLHRYLFQQDYFEGLIYIDDFKTVADPAHEKLNKIEFDYKRGKMSHSMFKLHLSWGVQIVRGTDAMIMSGYADFTKGQEFVCLEIMEPTGTNGWGSSGKYIVVPAESPEAAAELFHENIFQSWQIGRAEAEERAAKSKPEA